MTAVVYESVGVRWLDTRQLEWEPMPGLPGLAQKVLVRDAAGEPSVTMNYLPAGPILGDLPYRHLHRTVREFLLIVEGEYSGWEYESPEQAHGNLLWKRRDFFMVREPGSIHGVEAGPTSSTGAVIVNWRQGGPGVWIGEHNYDQESATVPYGDGAGFVPTADAPHEAGAACVRNRGGVTWIDTRLMEWEPMPGLGAAGFRRKVLWRDAEGEPSVTLAYIPPGGLSHDGKRHRHYHPNVREFVYVLAGEYPGTEYSSPEDPGTEVRKRAGAFMVRDTMSLHGVEPGQSTPTGAIILNWREGGSGVWVGEKGWHEECVEVPYPDEV